MMDFAMEQQISSRVWMTPTVCVLEPQHVFQNTLPLHGGPQTHVITHPGQSGFLHPHIIAAPPQGIFTIPQLHPALDSTGKTSIRFHQRHVPPLLTRQAAELPITLPTSQNIIKIQEISPQNCPSSTKNFTKVAKRKRISPSAKRRSRLRLIAFLESKKKQQEEIDENKEISFAEKENPISDLLLTSTDEKCLNIESNQEHLNSIEEK